MKNKLVFAGLLIAVLTIGFIAVGCATTGSSNSGNQPELSDFIVLTRENAIAGLWVPVTTFTVEEGKGVNIGIKGTDEDGDVKKIFLTLKKDGVEIRTFERDITVGKRFTQMVGAFLIPPGEYTGEVYVTDKKQNKSNVLTVDFTVKE